MRGLTLVTNGMVAPTPTEGSGSSVIVLAFFDAITKDSLSAVAGSGDASFGTTDFTYTANALSWDTGYSATVWKNGYATSNFTFAASSSDWLVEVPLYPSTATVEMQDPLVDFLRANLPDYNSVSRVGSQWIYPDQPRIKDLKINSYPRVSVELLLEPGEVAGTESDDIISEITFQVTVWTMKGLNCTVGAVTKEGQHLCNQIARDIKSKLRQRWRTDATIRGKFFDYGYVSRPVIYDDELRLFRKIIEIQLLSITPGE